MTATAAAEPTAASLHPPGYMDAAARHEFIRANGLEAHIREMNANAEPPPDEALDLLRRLGCPLPRRAPGGTTR